MRKHLFKLLYEVGDSIVSVLVVSDSIKLQDARDKVESKHPLLKTLASYQYLGAEETVIFEP